MSKRKMEKERRLEAKRKQATEHRNQELIGSMRFLIDAQRTMLPKEREALWDLLMDGYCRHCGVDNPNCQCWNDE